MAMVAVAAGMLAGGVAHASGRHEQWKAVKRLAAGVPVEVEVEQGRPEQCEVVSADDAALTCRRVANPDADWKEGDGARLVFPRGAVRAVWVWQDVSDRRILIKMAVGFGIGALVCSEAGPGPAFICAGIGALIGACATAPEPPRYPMPGMPVPSYPRQERDWEWKIRYRAPAAAGANGAATP
jgi:hypothetical protein